MAVYTYQLTVGGQKVTAKAAKDIVQRLNSDIGSVSNIRAWRRELTGVIGENERATEYWLMYGQNSLPLPDPEGYEADKAALFHEIQSAPQPLGKDACIAFSAKAVALRKKHMAVEDNRRTPQQQAEFVAQSNAARAQGEEKRANEKRAFMDRFADSADEISWGDGQMAVFLDMVYDNSDGMSDYFDRHHSWGQDLLLAVVPKGAETERVARAAIANYPDLAGYVFEWKTEKWSMGHGNYLTSLSRHNQAMAAVDKELEAKGQNRWDVDWYRLVADAEAALPDGCAPDIIAEGVTTYGGVQDPAITFEIRFQSRTGKMTPYKGYAAAHATAPTAETAPVTSEIFTIQPDYHEKRGVPIWIVKINKKVERTVYDRYAAIASRYKARWSSWGPKSKHGFVFFSENDAKDFVAKAS